MENREEWVGTAMELLKELGKRVDEDVRRYKTWPKQPQHLSRHLKRLAPVLRGEGIEVEDLPRQGGARKKRIFKKRSADEPREHPGDENPDRKATPSSKDDDAAGEMTPTTGEAFDDRH